MSGLVEQCNVTHKEKKEEKTVSTFLNCYAYMSLRLVTYIQVVFQG